MHCNAPRPNVIFFLMKEKIFITGSTGCIGNYLMDCFLNNPDYELHILVRELKKLHPNYQNASNIKVHMGDMHEIEKLKSVIAQMDYLVHIATDWSFGQEIALKLNVQKTLELFSFCDLKKCKKILYFSTASVLDQNNNPIKEAGEIGPGYIRSKYIAHQKIKELPYKDKIIVLFPTIVIGGDSTHKYTHITEGLVPNIHYAKILRFFYLDAKFHFMHAQDIATVTKHLITHNVPGNSFVFGTKVITGKQAIKTICKVFNVPVYFQIKINAWLALKIAKLFKVDVHPWTEFCLDYPYFEYKTVSPDTFGLKTQFPDLETTLENIKSLT
jgi:nucleoside-diphosphate-sugar epimerase